MCGRLSRVPGTAVLKIYHRDTSHAFFGIRVCCMILASRSNHPGALLHGQPQHRRCLHPRRGPEALPVERDGRQHVREVQGRSDLAAHQGKTQPQVLLSVSPSLFFAAGRCRCRCRQSRCDSPVTPPPAAVSRSLNRPTAPYSRLRDPSSYSTCVS